MKKSLLALTFALVCLLLFPGRILADSPETLVFQTGLSPAKEVPPVTGLNASGTATITVFLSRDGAGVVTSGTVDFDISFSGFPAGTQFTGLHIHNGDATVAGPVVIGTNLSRSNSVVSATGTGNIFRRVVVNAGTPAANFLRGLAARPELYYVNLHTTVHPGGAIRGQLAANRLVFRTLMGPDQEVPPVTELSAIAVATTTLHVSRDSNGAIVSGSVDFDLAYQFPEIVTFTGFHIHRGPAGANGPVVISSGLGSGNNSITIPGVRGNLYRRADIAATNAAGLAALEGILADPSQFYVNLHTTVHPGGVVRGQLSGDSYAFLKTMLPLFEVPPISQLATEGQALIAGQVVRDGTGNITSGSIQFNIDFSIGAGSTTFTGLHIHNGAEGVNGPVVISSGLSSDNTFTSDSGIGSILRTIAVGEDAPAALNALRGLVDLPERYYVNLHTPANPGGLLRSQLERTMLVYRLTMRPENEVPATEVNATAAATIVARLSKNAAGNAILATVDFDVAYQFPPGTTFTGLHLHSAPVGVNGPVLISSGLSNAASITDDDGAGVIFRRATIVPESTAALEALDSIATNPDRFYANLHTTIHPGGAVRAQLATNVHHFAQAGGGGGNSTTISLNNPSPTASASGFAYFFGPDGSPQDTAVNQAAVPFVIPPGGTAAFTTNSQAPVRSGYARVLTPDILIPGFAAAIPGFAPVSDGASRQNAFAFRARVRRNASDGTDAGVAVVNVSDQTVRVVFSLSDSPQARGVLQRVSVILRPGEQISRLLSELFPGLQSLEATLTVSALAPFPTQSIVATVVQLSAEQIDIVPLEPVTKTATSQAEERQ